VLLQGCTVDKENIKKKSDRTWRNCFTTTDLKSTRRLEVRSKNGANVDGGGGYEMYRDVFHVFKRDSYRAEDVDSHARSQYDTAREVWKNFVSRAVPFDNVQVTYGSTTTGSNYARSFWDRVRDADRSKEASSVSVVIDRSRVSIAMDWEWNMEQDSAATVEDHNQWIHHVQKWIEATGLNPKQYKLWTSLDQDGSLKSSPTLFDFISNEAIRDSLLSRSAEASIQVGVEYTEDEFLALDDPIKTVSDHMKCLYWIYQYTSNRKYWLFNVFYSANPKIWKHCQALNAALMQYEIGKQNPVAVANNLDLIKQIKKGDFVVAYSGKASFLGYGVVTREFYEEDDESRFIRTDAPGEHWRQRIGVEWRLVHETPVGHKRSGFKSFVGLPDKTVMGSYTIFEIPREGFEKIRRELKQSAKGGKEQVEENRFFDYVSSRGFNFEKEVLDNYVLSLKTKPFVILSGISGTGKTKIAQFFAEFMGEDASSDVEVQNFEQDDETSYIQKVGKSFFERKIVTLSREYTLLLDLPAPGTTKKVAVKVNGREGTASLGQDVNGVTQLRLTGEAGSMFQEHFREGDDVRIRFTKHGEKQEEDLILIEKCASVRRKVTHKRYCFLSVRPDWIDNRGLLGYYNPITNKYEATELLKLLIRAANDDKKRPYFVILDEMNLAKVEHYFSDFLSCLESRRVGPDGNIVGESLILHDQDDLEFVEDGQRFTIPKRLVIPENVYFTGTVNIDETTYMFSPKVLDRANVIEFNEVNLESYKERLKEQGVEGVQFFASDEFVEKFTSGYSHLRALIRKEFTFDDKLESCYNHLVEINKLLQPQHLHFGYRVVDEILFYIENARQFGYFSELDALDLQILQRILPKFFGNRKKLEATFVKLLNYFYQISDANLALSKAEYEYLMNGQASEGVRFVGKDPLFPRSTKKLIRMLISLRDHGFVSFIE
jgi:energy-coupling factor transporter ATP-binding protein EcfA2